ncbi:hypothetical protein FB451DRAFT_1392667 [Mycena latifolia]|nr:hypothetical protein FB451DRAFT_1392667 [Mycena latifolia]
MSGTAPVLEGVADQHFYNFNLGPFLTGLTVQMYMMGVLTLQMWQYFEEHRSDTWPIRTLVIVLFLASTLQAATDFQMMYGAFVTGYGRIDHWNHFGWTLIYEPAWTAFIGAMAQGFFLHRCWQVTRSVIVLLAGIAGILVSLGAGIAGSRRSGRQPILHVRSQTSLIVVPITTWLIATAVTDIGISTILTPAQLEDGVQNNGTSHLVSIELHAHEPTRPTFRRRIVRITFETAALTSVIALVDLVVYLTTGKKHGVHLAFQFVIGKTYNHSVMVTLLARTRIRNEFDSNSAGRIGTDSVRAASPVHFSTRLTQSASQAKGTTPVGITVTRTQIRATDHIGYPMNPMKSITATETDDDDAGEAKFGRIVV